MDDDPTENIDGEVVEYEITKDIKINYIKYDYLVYVPSLQPDSVERQAGTGVSTFKYGLVNVNEFMSWVNMAKNAN